MGQVLHVELLGWLEGCVVNSLAFPYNSCSDEGTNFCWASEAILVCLSRIVQRFPTEPP